MSTSNGSEPSPAQLELLHWIRERYKIYLLKETGSPKPWSEDPVFQKTYFCNVHRENDRVTKWIRQFYSPHVGDRMFEYNIILARFLNWPDTLEEIGYQVEHLADDLHGMLQDRAHADQKVWGGAYVITTHGIPMPKATYLVKNVLGGVVERYERLLAATRPPGGGTCIAAYNALQGFEGMGSFLAAQVVADLKNTPGHPLYVAPDRDTFVAHGPGSIKGASWFFFSEPNGITAASFYHAFATIRSFVNYYLESDDIPRIDNQDLQNCLCEYDKYMRVKTGAGKSKRGYQGVG